MRAGAALNEYWTLSTRYTLSNNNTTLSDNGQLSVLRPEFAQFVVDQQAIVETGTEADAQAALNAYDFNNDGIIDQIDFDLDGNGIVELDEYPLDLLPDPNTLIGSQSRFLRDSIGRRWQSILGYTVGFDTRNSLIRPTRGRSFYFSQDFAGLGGDVRYVRSRVNFDNYWTPFAGWTFTSWR